MVKRARTFAACAAFALPIAASASVARTPRVFYHATYRSAAREPASAFARIGYAGSVTSLPAVLNDPSLTAYDSRDGNVYVVDLSAQTAQLELLRVSPGGATTRVTTFAFQSAFGMTYDPQTDRLYLIARSPQYGSNEVIYAVTSRGAATVLAGGGSATEQDGRGTAAGFGNASGITTDTANGSLYVADGTDVRRVTTSGVVTTITTSLQPPTALAYDAKRDRLIVAFPASNEILSMSLAAGALAPLAGQCLYLGKISTYSCDPLLRDGPAATAQFAQPAALAVGPQSGTIYVADESNNVIRRIDATGAVTTLAGNGIAAERDGLGQAAEFDRPAQIALDAVHDRLYALDTFVDLGTSVETGTLRAVSVTGLVPPPPASPVTLFDTATPDRVPVALDWRPTTPPSTGLWYSERNGGIARIAPSGVSTELADPFAQPGSYTGPEDIVLGADGSQWFYDPSTFNYITHHTARGFSAVAVPGPPFPSVTDPVDTLALGPGGNVWFVIDGEVGYVTPAEKAVAFGSLIESTAASLAVAADQTVWVASGSSLTQFDRNGRLLQTLAYGANYVTQGPDGNIWFTQSTFSSDAIGTIRSNGSLLVYPLIEPVAGCPAYRQSCTRGVGAIAAGSDGALWFAETQTTPGIGRLTPDGVLQEFPILTARSYPNDVSAGPDGNLWFVDYGAQKLGRVNLIGSAIKRRRL
jgi:virginiamycin B lyase